MLKTMLTLWAALAAAVASNSVPSHESWTAPPAVSIVPVSVRVAPTTPLEGVMAVMPTAAPTLAGESTGNNSAANKMAKPANRITKGRLALFTFLSLSVARGLWRPFAIGFKDRWPKPEGRLKQPEIILKTGECSWPSLGHADSLFFKGIFQSLPQFAGNIPLLHRFGVPDNPDLASFGPKVAYP
jgi:hypothetical protein